MITIKNKKIRGLFTAKKESNKYKKALKVSALIAAASIALSACGTGGPSNSGSDSSAKTTAWFLTGMPNEKITKDAQARFNKANPDNQITSEWIQNDAYKTKIKTAVGADQAPDLIYSWGGGTLRSYVENDKVVDLTDWVNSTPEIKDRVLDSTWGAGTVDGKIYAIPVQNITPIVLYYNKKVFKENNLNPPETWADVEKLITEFNKKGVAPFSLGGQSRWTSMMWLEYFLDRIGGPEVFQNILEGKKDAWSDPAVVETIETVQKMVKDKAFIEGFASITADSNADRALLTTGKAAMMLHGAWVYGGIKSSDPEFVKNGDLGFVKFPSMPGGKGDINNTVGNPANYFSISSKSSKKDVETAKKFLIELINKKTTEDYIASGGVPAIKDIEDQLAKTGDSEFQLFSYSLANEAEAFTQSWDQALSPAQAEALLNNIDQVFALAITPDEFVKSMNASLGK